MDYWRIQGKIELISEMLTWNDLKQMVGLINMFVLYQNVCIIQKNMVYIYI